MFVASIILGHAQPSTDFYCLRQYFALWKPALVNSSLTRQNVSMHKAGLQMVSHLHSTRLLIGGKVLPKSRSNRRRRFTAEMPIAIAVQWFTTPEKNPSWIFFSPLVANRRSQAGRVDPHTRVGTFLSQALSPYLMPNPHHQPCTHLR